MKHSINLFSENSNEIEKFLKLYYSKEISLENQFVYKEEFDTPINMIDFISCFVDNNNKFNASLWVSIDTNIYIYVTENNIDSIIKYFYERYPY